MCGLDRSLCVRKCWLPQLQCSLRNELCIGSILKAWLLCLEALYLRHMLENMLTTALLCVFCCAWLHCLPATPEITIFERGPYVSFANCGLPYFIGDIIEVGGVGSVITTMLMCMYRPWVLWYFFGDLIEVEWRSRGRYAAHCYSSKSECCLKDAWCCVHACRSNEESPVNLPACQSVHWPSTLQGCCCLLIIIKLPI